MADVAEPSAAPEAPSNVGAFVYDESLLIRGPKNKVIPPEKPDMNERNLQVDKLRQLEKQYRDRAQEISQTIDAKRNSGRSVSGPQQEIIKRLNELKSRFTTQLREKQAIRDQLNSFNAEKESLHAQLRSIKEKTKDDRVPLKLDTIDSRIAEYQHRLDHESLEEKEWRDMNDRVSKLKALRPLALEHTQCSAALNDVQRVRGELIERLKQMDDVLSEIKNVEEQERQRLQELKSREQDETIDIPALVVERKDCYEIVSQTRDKITEIRAAFDAKYQEYVKLDKNYNAYLRWEKHQKYEEKKKKREAEQQERQEKYQERQTNFVPSQPDPFETELFKCDQMVVYLKKLAGITDEAAEKVEEAKQVVAPDGMVAYKRKKDEELETMFGGIGRKNKQKPEKGGKSAPEASGSSAPKPAAKKLVHDLDTLKTFMDIKVEVPQTTAALEETITKVEERKAEYKQKQAAEKERRLNPPAPTPAPAPAVEEASKAEAPEENGHGEAADASADKPGEVAAAAVTAAEGEKEGEAAEEKEEEAEEEEEEEDDDEEEKPQASTEAAEEPQEAAEEPEEPVHVDETPLAAFLAAPATEYDMVEPEPLPEFEPEPESVLEEMEPQEEPEVEGQEEADEAEEAESKEAPAPVEAAEPAKAPTEEVAAPEAAEEASGPAAVEAAPDASPEAPAAEAAPEEAAAEAEPVAVEAVPEVEEGGAASAEPAVEEPAAAVAETDLATDVAEPAANGMAKEQDTVDAATEEAEGEVDDAKKVEPSVDVKAVDSAAAALTEAADTDAPLDKTTKQVETVAAEEAH